jgi:hypothetical protein
MKQWDALNATVNQVIQQTPGTPFNLGQVEVDVTASIADTSPVTVGIDQSQIANLNLTNAAQALDYLPGVDIQHLDTNAMKRPAGLSPMPALMCDFSQRTQRSVTSAKSRSTRLRWWECSERGSGDAVPANCAPDRPYGYRSYP